MFDRITLLLGVVVHLAIGVPTVLGYYIGLNALPEISPKK